MTRPRPVSERVSAFASRLPFTLDDFQLQALAAVEGGRSVLVAAPTGSGKTVVAEFACWLALTEGAKCFYTTPLKALSNQKFGDLVAQHHAQSVGLLTGDNSINGEAPLVVMTTEVLRNMLYEGSPTLQGLRWVVLDEVHYLQDPYRGAVWEEVLIHLPAGVRVVCLSATVSNVEEFGDWLRTLRGDTEVVVERKRPVELRHLVMAGTELYPLFDELGRPNASLRRVWSRAPRARRGGRRPPLRGGKGGDGPYTPSRLEVARALAAQEMLPAIVFIFSRAGCDEAVDACARAGLCLVSDEERERISEFARLRTAAIEPDDLRALRFGAFLDALERGLAAHHAGMLPIFKETVEELFAMGLLKLVFATETLSLGINMPARTVVIERLTKFTGERHEALTPTDYTQLTGRAGRRGIDEMGYAVTLYNPWVRLERVCELATLRSYTLRSSFRPSYNMAVNLVHRHDPDTATRLLNSSFAQFVTDRSVVEVERELHRKLARADELRDRVACSAGDVVEYARLRARAEDASRGQRGSAEVREAIVRLAPGDVVWGDAVGRAIIVEQARVTGSGAVRVTAMTADRKVRRLGPRDFGEPPVPVARLAVGGGAWRSAKARRGLAERLREVAGERPPSTRGSNLRQLVRAFEEHPVHACPQRDRHLEAAFELVGLEEEIARLRRSVGRRRGTLARSFRRVVGVLEELGYVCDWSLTSKGETLRRVYNEADLLVVECLDRGWFADLDGAELAAAASVFVYEQRRRDEPEDPPTPALRRWTARLNGLYSSLRATEERHRVDLLKEPDPGFMAQIHEWASGAALEDVLEGRETSAGDFVRSAKQVVDLLQQLKLVAWDGELGEALGEAIPRVQRGVVAYSSVV